jgi:hypothetical protein
MSTGGVFKLIANDGKADRMVMATMLLNQRIKEVMCARKAAGKADITPTLGDIERTHILFVNAHFKPFAAIGYEYNKVRTQAGQAVLGGGVTFSIPQFGDFFHDMVVRMKFSSFSTSEITLPPNTADTSTETYTWVDFNKTLLTPGEGVTYKNLVRWCEFPGNRLFQSVKFDVNGNPLDEYFDSTSSALQKFTVQPNKETGYNRLVGQENCVTGYKGLAACKVVDNDSANTPQAAFDAAVPIYNGNTGDNLNGDNADIHRECLKFARGPQTPKYTQPSLEIWNKLRFWFNDDARLSIPSVSIPFGQRYINVELAAQSLLAFEFNNLFECKSTEVIGSGELEITYAPQTATGTITDITIQKMELYVNNIFVNPEIHDIYIKRIGFSLIRVYRQHKQRVSQDSEDELLLSQLKWPIEYMFVCFRPSYNIASSNINQWRDWHRCTRIVDAECRDNYDVDLPNAVIGGAANSGMINTTSEFIIPTTYEIPIATVDSVSLTAHGITIYDNFESIFFNAYQPFHYGGPAIRTPEDTGALFINFALFPGSYQPSGHINISRAREFFIKWTTTYISNSTPADLLAVAIAINFLLITDGSAVLRYST